MSGLRIPDGDGMKGVVLPWPSPDLSPNSRAHWAARARAAAKARRDATLACQAAGIRALPWTGMHVAIEFCPPDNRRRDTDNLLASLNGALDGVADASGVDDSRWTYTIAQGAKVKGGAVIVTVTESTWQPVRQIAAGIASRIEHQTPEAAE